ncbi:MAG: radical SAM protein [Betaproteobacteria bacterium]|jgi:wyosine [tRNA(Phe)-imidazoG37] synthetase (radical SAM superfamily)|nr:radical SAM protein [Betaproteobacteria bacterium]MCH1424175.1 radical SAM protein [Burkholderiales bacterium]MDC0500663.1 radical SAM protein [Burkholderiales bacterium]HAT52940.1 radical SAM protein [Betaproteobacteria bacterium]
MLSIKDHNRFQEGFEYVYPVVSRRAGGLSLGINLNTNNACNWRCIYCQVPDLIRGAPPPVDLDALEEELSVFLSQILIGSYLEDQVPKGQRRLNDIAFSGNGEPTSAPNFADAVKTIHGVRVRANVPEVVKTVLITNGSLMHQHKVMKGVKDLAGINGEVWFKIDRATVEGAQLINDTKINKSRIMSNLEASAKACPTWIQTCLFKLDGLHPADSDLDAYVQLIGEAVARGIPFKGILLYGLARQSHQPESARLSKLDDGWLNAFAHRLRELGVTVNCSE